MATGNFKSKILVIPWGFGDVVQPFLPAIAAAYDLDRVREGWSTSHYMTADTLHVCDRAIEDLQGAGFGRHIVLFVDAMRKTKDG